MTANNQDQWKLIGKVGRPFGVKGEFYLQTIDANMPSKKHKHLLIGSDISVAKQMEIKNHKSHKNKTILTVAEILDRTHLEKNFVGLSVWGLKEISDFEYEGHLGLQVYDKDNKLLGKIEAFYEYGAGLVVKIHSSSINSYLEIPYTDKYIKDFNKLKASKHSKDKIELTVEEEQFEGLWSQE
jgi:ribosomal 30S subunit maturation factor RimM